MKDRIDIENSIKNENEFTPTPELKQRVINIINNVEPTPLSQTQKEKKPFFKRFKGLIAVAASLVLIAIGTASGFGLYNENYQSVYIDVNPSIELVLNRFEKINDVNFYNDDAEQLFKDVKIKNMSAEDGLETVLNVLYDNDYLKDDSEVYITTASNKNKNTDKLLEKMIAKSKEHSTKKGYKANINSSSASKEDVNDSLSNGLTPAKQKLIDDIIKLDGNYKLIDLKDLSMKSLQKIYKDLKDAGHKK